MKSKYNCPVCGQALDWDACTAFDESRDGVVVWCDNDPCVMFPSGTGDTEHLAYQNLVERVEKKD